MDVQVGKRQGLEEWMVTKRKKCVPNLQHSSTVNTTVNPEIFTLTMALRASISIHPRLRSPISRSLSSWGEIAVDSCGPRATEDAVAVGFIGLGSMGGRLAHRIIKHGHRVNVFDVCDTPPTRRRVLNPPELAGVRAHCLEVCGGSGWDTGPESREGCRGRRCARHVSP